MKQLRTLQNKYRTGMKYLDLWAKAWIDKNEENRPKFLHQSRFVKKGADGAESDYKEVQYRAHALKAFSEVVVAIEQQLTDIQPSEFGEQKKEAISKFLLLYVETRLMVLELKFVMLSKDEEQSALILQHVLPVLGTIDKLETRKAVGKELQLLQALSKEFKEGNKQEIFGLQPNLSQETAQLYGKLYALLATKEHSASKNEKVVEYGNAACSYLQSGAANLYSVMASVMRTDLGKEKNSIKARGFKESQKQYKACAGVASAWEKHVISMGRDFLQLKQCEVLEKLAGFYNEKVQFKKAAGYLRQWFDLLPPGKERTNVVQRIIKCHLLIAKPYRIADYKGKMTSDYKRYKPVIDRSVALKWYRVAEKYLDAAGDCKEAITLSFMLGRILKRDDSPGVEYTKGNLSEGTRYIHKAWDSFERLVNKQLKSEKKGEDSEEEEEGESDDEAVEIVEKKEKMRAVLEKAAKLKDPEMLRLGVMLCAHMADENISKAVSDKKGEYLDEPSKALLSGNFNFNRRKKPLKLKKSEQVRKAETISPNQKRYYNHAWKALTQVHYNPTNLNALIPAIDYYWLCYLVAAKRQVILLSGNNGEEKELAQRVTAGSLDEAYNIFYAEWQEKTRGQSYFQYYFDSNAYPRHVVRELSGELVTYCLLRKRPLDGKRKVSEEQIRSVLTTRELVEDPQGGIVPRPFGGFNSTIFEFLTVLINHNADIDAAVKRCPSIAHPKIQMIDRTTLGSSVGIRNMDIEHLSVALYVDNCPFLLGCHQLVRMGVPFPYIVETKTEVPGAEQNEQLEVISEDETISRNDIVRRDLRFFFYVTPKREVYIHIKPEGGAVICSKTKNTGLTKIQVPWVWEKRINLSDYVTKLAKKGPGELESKLQFIADLIYPVLGYSHNRVGLIMPGQSYSLKDYIRREAFARLTIRQRVGIMLQLAQGVQVLLSKNIRDCEIKSRNIVVIPGQNGVPKVKIDVFNTTFGEALAGGGINPRLQARYVRALGLVFNEMLLGEGENDALRALLKANGKFHDFTKARRDVNSHARLAGEGYGLLHTLVTRICLRQRSGQINIENVMEWLRPDPNTEIGVSKKVVRILDSFDTDTQKVEKLIDLLTNVKSLDLSGCKLRDGKKALINLATALSDEKVLNKLQGLNLSFIPEFDNPEVVQHLVTIMENQSMNLQLLKLDGYTWIDAHKAVFDQIFLKNGVKNFDFSLEYATFNVQKPVDFFQDFVAGINAKGEWCGWLSFAGCKNDVFTPEIIRKFTSLEKPVAVKFRPDADKGACKEVIQKRHNLLQTEFMDEKFTKPEEGAKKYKSSNRMSIGGKTSNFFTGSFEEESGYREFSQTFGSEVYYVLKKTTELSDKKEEAERSGMEQD